jgi:K+-sensing histidine kinase KdpD
MATPDGDSKPQSVEFLFLASHGLLSPISAIRWGCNRLKRTDTKKLSKEQRDILDHIYGNARVLSKLFASMLLLARNEDRTYPLREEPVAIKPLLQAGARDWEELSKGTVHLKEVGMLKARTDGGILETIIQNVFTVFAEASTEPKSLHISGVMGDDGLAEIVFESTMELPFLQSVRTIDNLSESKPIVGGTPGLMLSLSHALVGFLDGTLEMREATEDSYVIVLRVPA